MIITPYSVFILEAKNHKAKNKYTSNRIKRLSNRINNKIKDYLHKLSYTIIKYMEDNQLNTLFVGKNIGWKENINIGKVNNQNFISIPYNMLISMLDYFL